MSRTALACLCSLTMVTSGCASLLNSGPSLTTVVVSPESATVRLSPVGKDQNAMVLTGPTHLVSLSKGHDYVLSVGERGYAPREILLQRHVAPAFWGNLGILGGGLALIGMSYLGAADSGGVGRAFLSFIALPLVIGGGLTAMGIDAANGSMWNHDQSVSVTLTKTDASTSWPY